MTEREFALDVVRRLAAAGYITYWAGGCVRDELLGLAPADYDVASNARPEQVVKLFRRTVEVGASFGVVEVIGPRREDDTHHKVQVATFRSDGAYLDGRHPESVTYATAEEDASRRDFTINGMFFDPVAEQVMDFVGGQQDLQAKILRAIGDPRARFQEDKLRLMRAVRMSARFGFPIEEATKAAIREMAPQITVVSAERIAEEFRKMLEHPARAGAMAQLREIGLLSPILPEIAKGLTADETTWDRVLRVLESLPTKAEFPLAFAAMIHPVGKKLAGQACRRLKLSNHEQARVEWLAEHHLTLRDAEKMPKSRLYPLLIQPGIRDLIDLHRAMGQSPEFTERILRDTPPETLNPPPLLTGDDLTANGFTPGPMFKKILQATRDAQLDGEITTLEEAMAMAGRM
ncbi:CCA tRNA nucleotidyltransferase [Zavarzinella formosa]|uniref:CCA tRNA nucleotidyltransferase n=1 Tax=Zavarzinella formosa TaxID=360055 RepID=UPI0003637D62|nr:CCA tRNA nucleotidyltransferase [Zavarzinella formosa]